ncbi:P-loop containing nucleoside triphosphate hydrolase protein [Infundibulicybe gibba]|nr:P-loop containing nucleoside triphosphate hydrolase protein [Infundibulicybe gibba]
MSGPVGNPYLAHWHSKRDGGTKPSNSESSSSATTKEPLFGFLPRRVTGAQVRKAMEQDVNPFTKQPLSAQYKKILETRKKLSVFSQMDEFYNKFSKHQIIIIVGETGSGKTTQIPQFVAYSDLPHTKGKLVACTQPQRVAAMSVAKRVADEMDVQLGRQVGYSIRFEDMSEPGTTFLNYMTDEVLLREAMNDPQLKRYSTIILDEVHERTLATDILMGLLKYLARRRTDLKIIVMSAPLSSQVPKILRVDCRLPAPLFKVLGRTHPVETFIPGAGAGLRACRKIKLEADDLKNQDPDSVGPLVCRIFDAAPPPHTPGGPAGRKVVVSTNIAETSLTIDGIVYVVDPGFSEQKVYNPRIRVESLLASPISKPSAQQRAGHFMSELEEQTHPEILRSNLSSTVLELVKFGIKDLVRFDYVDAPAPETLMRALELLNYLAALDDDGNITDLGSIMAEFPLDPQLAKMLIVSPDFKCSNEMLTITAMMSVPNVWLRSNNQRREADAAKQSLTISDSDHLTLLNVYNSYTNYLSRAHSLKRGCALSLERIMERFEIELISLQDEKKLHLNIRQALVCGFFMQVAHREGEKGNYLTVKDNQVVALHPSCGLEPQPEWVIFNEFVLTTRPYIRTVSEVRPNGTLIDSAKNYFDLSTFPDGETKGPYSES